MRKLGRNTFTLTQQIQTTYSSNTSSCLSIFILISSIPSTTFKTIPTDSTGVAHVLEHTALCGSKKFPVRDPFFNMLKRSVNTYMNAYTGLSLARLKHSNKFFLQQAIIHPILSRRKIRRISTTCCQCILTLPFSRYYRSLIFGKKGIAWNLKILKVMGAILSWIISYLQTTQTQLRL